ncbi:MAG: hypothetical protein VST71_05025 [Nitrospirota bacterium]|nr:hypothetical protein [Nitrospirota bacterium]
MTEAAGEKRKNLRLRIMMYFKNVLRKKILDCGGGPASFNSALAERGIYPVCRFSDTESRQRINET